MWNSILRMLDDVVDMLSEWIIPIMVAVVMWAMLAFTLCVAVDEFTQFAQDVHVVADSIRDANSAKE